MSICIDASVAVKWAVPEEDSDKANLLLMLARRNEDILVAPPHLTAEVTSAIHKRVRMGRLSRSLGIQMLTFFETLPLRRWSPRGLSSEALRIAVDLEMKYPYDAFYLALGELLDCEVWTADRSLYAVAHASYPHLRILSDFVVDKG